MNSNLAFLFLEELGNTLIMTFASSALAYVIGIPLGILLVVWAKNGIRPNPRAQEALGVIINLIPFCSVPDPGDRHPELHQKAGGHQRGNQGYYRASDSGVGPLCGQDRGSILKRSGSRGHRSGQIHGRFHLADHRKGAPSGGEARL